MLLRGIGTAAVALALVGSAPASAVTWRVEEGGGACDDTTCGSIAAAADAAGSNDVIEITPRAGGWPATPAVELDQQHITVRGVDSGEVRVNGTLTFTGAGTGSQSLTVERLSLFAPSGGNALRLVSEPVSGDKTVSIQGSILSGNGANAALYASTEFALNEIDVTARHVTIADKDGAPTVTEEESEEGLIDVTFFNSLLPAVAEYGSLFAAPSAEDFRLRVGSPAIGDGGTGAGGEIAKDVDGEDRDAAWDRGGDEFVNHAPAKPSLSGSPAQLFEGESVAFTVTGATDPDGRLQDEVVKYVWDFGDGVVEQRTPGGASHAYAADGTYQARVTAVDKTGTAGPPSDPVTIVVQDPPPPPPGAGGGLTSLTQLPGFEAGIDPARRGPDADPPYVAFEFPRARQVVRVGRTTPVLRGRNADVSGVRRVELALMRREGARCRWYDGRRAFRLGGCGNPVWFKVVLDDFSWRHRFPRGVRPRPGRYVALVRAFDYLGNRTSAFGPANAISFRIAR